MINLNKCEFAKEEINFLGFYVTAKGLSPDKSRVDVIQNFKRPITINGLQSWLGMLNFYRIFMPQAAHDQAKLFEHLKGRKKKDNSPVIWTEESNQAFETCKVKLANSTLLVYPSRDAKIAIFVDASNTAIGAVLQQQTPTGWQPLCFFSRKLTKTETNYSTYDRELLAAYAAIKYFKNYVEGREFTLFTDHKPLTFSLYQNLEKASPRQRRHLDLIAQFTSDIRHISGVDNIVADTLSRVEEINVGSSIDYASIADEQAQDTELIDFIRTSSSLNFKKFPVFGTEKEIVCDVSTGIERPFIPKAFRRHVFESFHNMSHPSIRTTAKLISKKFVWPSMNVEVRSWAKQCLQCQKSKISRHVKSKVGNYEPTSQRFSEIHIDLIGPLPPSEGNIYCLTMIDRYTRWPEIAAIPDMKTETIANALIKSWISRFGVPLYIVTDRGAQFESSLYNELSKLLGFQRKRTTAYNPSCNGLIERWHRTLKGSIMCVAEKQWSKSLPLILLGLRTSFRDDFKSTSAELVYGEHLRLPGDFLQPCNNAPQSEFILQLRNRFKDLQPVIASRHSKDKIFVFKDLATCENVLVRTDAIRHSLQPPYEGPYPVVKRNDKFYTLIIKGVESTVSINRLKPCFIEASNDQESTAPSTEVPSVPKCATKPETSNKGSTITPTDSNKKEPRKVSFSSDKITNNKFQIKSRSGRDINKPARYQ